VGKIKLKLEKRGREREGGREGERERERERETMIGSKCYDVMLKSCYIKAWKN
jgi:hypothetical protein